MKKKSIINAISLFGLTIMMTVTAGGRTMARAETDASDGRMAYAAGISFGWLFENNASYWYEGGIRQGTSSDPKGVMGDGTNRGREIYDPGTDAWYWLDSAYGGARATDKEVWIPYIYQQERSWSDDDMKRESRASDRGLSDYVYQTIRSGKGKWVRYDSSGAMMKGWVTIDGALAGVYPGQAGNTYYYDYKTGLMAKGGVVIDGRRYYFDEVTGALIYKDMLFVGDSRTVDMFYGDRYEISRHRSDGIDIYARDSEGCDYLRSVVAGYGYDSFDTLITWLGANDTGNFSSYRDFYESLLRRGKKLIVCTVGPTVDEWLEDHDYPWYSNARMRAFNRELLSWANSRGVPVIDVYGYIVDNGITIERNGGIHYEPQPTRGIWKYIISHF